MNSVYGYARVSSTDQNAERRHLSLQRQGIPRQRIFTDRMSGKDFRRPRHEDLRARPRPGDQLCVTSIDRLGRNYEEIQRQWRLLTQELHVGWISGGTGTCWGPSLPTSCCRCSRSWPRTSGKTSGGAPAGHTFWTETKGPCSPFCRNA